MTRAIIWKEFQEQGLIGLTLLVFGAGILAATAAFADPPAQGASPADIVRFLGAGLLATMMLAVTAGTVCGGALFAAEREAGTIGFLESLPISRWQLWWAKFAAGTLLAVGEIAVILLLAGMMGLIHTVNWAFSIAVFAMLAYVWGVYGSTLAKTTLGSVGVAVPSATLAFILFYIPVAIFFQNPRTNLLRTEGGFLFLGLMFFAPLLVSLIRFTRHDRDRRANDPTPVRRSSAADSFDLQPESPRVAPLDTRFGLKALLWLSWRQLRRPGLVILLFAAALGATLLPDNLHPVILWPGLALTAGVLAGVTMFMDEQSGGSVRFWGERRLPIGRLWSVKLVVHALFALLLALVLLIPAAIRAEIEGMQMIRGGSVLSHTLRSMLFENTHLGLQGWRLMLLPLVYGFVAGHLSGMLLRKAVVAAGVAGVVGGSLAAFWIPSLLSGGTWHWQLWLPPLLALVTARLLLRPWSSERLPTRRPIVALIGGLAAVLLVTAAGLLWRVIEVPDKPGAEDDVEYVASLPPLEASDSGRFFRSAAERFAKVALIVPPYPRASGSGPRGSLDERIANLPFQGWTAEDGEVVYWIDNLYQSDVATGDQDETWYVQAERAALDPTAGIFEHPLRSGTTASLQTQANGRRMGLTLLNRGLVQQSRGFPGALPKNLRTTLALSRSLRKGSVVSSLNYGNELNRAGSAATDRWLERFEGHPVHLRLALDALQQDDAEPPFDPRPHLLAERFVIREFTRGPGQYLPQQLTPPGGNRELVSPVVDLIGVAWSVPWERERTSRLLSLGFEAGNSSREVRLLVRGRTGSSIFLSRKTTPTEMEESDRQIRLHRRAAMISVAVRLHQAEKQSTPKSLEELVSGGYLDSIPLDPYDGRPLRFRVSAGETLTSPTQNQSIPAGQVVLWSVGPDRTDESGRTLPTHPGTMRSGPDIVFLVPPVPAKP